MHRVFQVTILLSAFLLFQIQPLIGRYILPWFGGGAGVWSVMMVFFQFVLLVGYGYAHLLTRHCPAKWQLVIHLALLICAVLVLPVAPPESLKPDPAAEPVLAILLVLGATVGLPYFAVSTTGPLVQAWFARSFPGKSPYWLYAFSNVGSLLALLSYPFAVEPVWGRYEQAFIWSSGFGLFAMLCAGTAVISLKRGRGWVNVPGAGVADEKAPARSRYVFWVGLPALASILLLAFTNEICVDVASVPFLWILPLSCYLLSFVLTFSGKGGLHKKFWNSLGFVAVVGTASVMYWPGALDIPIQVMVAGYAASLFVLCCFLHGEVYKMRPSAKYLTIFYLCVSIGGIIGGLFVGIVSPIIFNSYMELPLVLILVFALLSYSSFDKFSVSNIRHIVPLFVFVFFIIYKVYDYKSNFIHSSRNFYGVYSVQDLEFDRSNGIRLLFSGTTLHGLQFTNPEFEVVPTQYYTRHSGVGIALASLSEGPKKVGIIGLGVGTLAVYGRPGDTYRFYEINPDSLRIAREYFSYLENARASVDVVLGDGRLNLEREESQTFDVLVLDAFTSDSIPLHLLTEEALDEYLRHLGPEGAICVHISNRHLDLTPMLKGLAEKKELLSFKWTAADDSNVSGVSNDYVILTRSRQFIERFNAMAEFARRHFVPAGKTPNTFSRRFDLDYVRQIRPWTDDFSNLFDVLKPIFRK